MGTEVWEPGMCRLHADAGAARGSGRKLSCDAFIHQFIYFVFFSSLGQRLHSLHKHIQYKAPPLTLPTQLVPKSKQL